VDGCFDLMHYGHANALRQAREMGDYLVVGVHSDEEIRRHKGIVVCGEAERYAAVRGCRWVDEVVEGAPYVTDVAVMDAHGCDFCVHGDDPSTDAHGADTYGAVKAAGRFRECRRTPSVSTTDLIGRMFCPGAPRAFANITTALWVSQFVGPRRRPPREGDRVVYVHGAFDLCHAGHVAFLGAARAHGDHLVAGVLGDDDVRRKCGAPPVLSLNERVLSVLACRHVDDVVIGAPLCVDGRLLDGQAGSCPRVSVVVVGEARGDARPPNLSNEGAVDAFAVPRARGILVEAGGAPFGYLRTRSLLDRIQSRRSAYEARNERKLAKEASLARR